MSYAPIPTLADLKRRLGIAGVSTSDEQLQWDLDVAIAWVDDRCYSDPAMPDERPTEVCEAMLMLAARYYARRNSPEGVIGWTELGVSRMVAEDPDLETLIERHVDIARMGIA